MLWLQTGLLKHPKSFENNLFIVHKLITVVIPSQGRGEEDVRQKVGFTFSLGSLLMVFRGLKTRSTRRDLMVLISRPLLVLPRRREAQAPKNGKERDNNLVDLGALGS